MSGNNPALNISLCDDIMMLIGLQVETVRNKQKFKESLDVIADAHNFTEDAEGYAQQVAQQEDMFLENYECLHRTNFWEDDTVGGATDAYLNPEGHYRDNNRFENDDEDLPMYIEMDVDSILYMWSQG
jgi:predicted neutral ceramidase superfamily lipid hydrolase